MDATNSIDSEEIGELHLPPAPPESTRAPFPVVASVAPLAAALVIWAITRSPFVLVFAVLGPIIAIATIVDARRHARRSQRRWSTEHALAVPVVRAQIWAAHRSELAELLAATPSAGRILDAGEDDPTRWQAEDGECCTVSVGLADLPSSIRLAGTVRSPDDRELRSQASVLADAPVQVDAAAGIGIIGPRAIGRSVARGYLIQLTHAAAPGRCAVTELPASGWDWARALPHAETRLAPAEIAVKIREGPARDGEGQPAGNTRGRSVTIAIADAARLLPTHCRTIVKIDSVSTATLVSRQSTVSRQSPVQAVTLRLELVTLQQATGYAEAMAAAARAAGIGAAAGIPDSLSWSDLRRGEQGNSGRTGASLSCAIGLNDTGVVCVDLVADGPHALIGGTTGSGKSELLVTWVTSMAERYSAAEVNFLLVDFKGGAAFAALAGLRHCVGVVTDLDHSEAVRALESLRAELRYRERVLAEAGARDITAVAGRLARLVIVVDEFAAMLDAFEELHALFVDIAARGRSLGMHLILCTQRPSGSVRDALLANCSLRMSLRVNNPQDSEAVVGSAAAAYLPAALPGRCMVSVPGGDRWLMQTAEVGAQDIAAVACGTAGATPRRPWLDPLPALVELASFPPAAPGGLLLGIEDVPAEQRQSPAEYRPAEHGHLLVVGAPASGKSTLLAVLAAQTGCSVRRLPTGIEQAWDTTMRWAAAARTGAAEAQLAVIDDLDVLLGRYDPEYAQALLDTLTQLLRAGPAAGIRVVCTTQRLGGALAGLTGLFSAKLLLRMTDRQEHVLAGGRAAEFVADLRPGAGLWRSHRIQLATSGKVPAALSRPAAAPALDFRAGRTYLLVSTNPQGDVRDLAALAPDAGITDITGVTGISDLAGSASNRIFVRSRCSILVGDPDSWQGNWSLLTEHRSRSEIIFNGCSAADARTLTRARALPPPLAGGPGRVWLWSAARGYSRRTLPRAG